MGLYEARNSVSRGGLVQEKLTDLLITNVLDLLLEGFTFFIDCILQKQDSP